MRLRSHALLGAAVVLAAAVGGCGGGGDGHGSGMWGSPNADLRNTRHVSGPIDAASVRRLTVAWRVRLPTLYTATPVVSDGVVYTQDMLSNVYAIDLASGRLRWKKTYNVADNGPNGVSVGNGLVYGATAFEAFALDATTGRQRWRKKLIRAPAESIDMAPGYAAGAVYVSTVPAGGGVVSTLWALDATTGATKWRWGQVPAELWGHPDVNGGGGMWHPPAFDGRGGLYVSIANPFPWPGTLRYPWGRSRPGPNKWNNSIVKLDVRTGKLVWGTQALPHDIYDWDLECPVILANVGRQRVALTAGKMGFVYAFDADTGALRWKRPVGLHNGHDRDGVRAMRGDYSGVALGKRILPGDWGGVETQMASDGRTVYVPVNNLWVVYHGQEMPEQQDAREGTGEIVAIDIATGRVKWDRKLPHSVYGAASISSDLVFTTTYDGMIWALRTDTGRPVWRSALPAFTDAPVAISGQTLIAGAGVALEAGQQPAIVAYRLRK